MKESTRVLYSKPSITEREIGYATDAAANGWGEHCYDYLVRFEKSFAEHMNVPFAVATSSGTGALHMGLAAAGIKPGDEVILADVNWIATAAPIMYLGAKPVLVDVLLDTWCIDPRSAAKAITARTRAIVATHIYGNLCEMQELRALCSQHGLLLVEDAAEAIGSSYDGCPAGSMGDFGIFSFHGTKTITTGEGGMLVTSDTELYERALTLSNHGRSARAAKQFWPEVIGFKYKMSNVQAAIGCAQLERLSELCERKRRIFEAYAHLLGRSSGLRMNPQKPGTVNGYWMPTVVFESEAPIDRDRLLRMFAEHNIDGRVFFHPLSSLPMFRPVAENRVSYHVSQNGVNLPSYHDMSDSDIERVASVVLSFLAQGVSARD